MDKEVSDLINQEIAARVKEISDTLSVVNTEVEVANQATIDTLKILETDFLEEDMTGFAKGILYKTNVIKSLLVSIDSIAKGILNVLAPTDVEH
jgi:hypothetical protein